MHSHEPSGGLPPAPSGPHYFIPVIFLFRPMLGSTRENRPDHGLHCSNLTRYMNVNSSLGILYVEVLDNLHCNKRE